MDKNLFLQDVSRKPDVLANLKGYTFGWPDLLSKRLLFVGMGSSHYAAKTIAHRLQIQGINAYAMLASVEAPPKLTDNDVVIAISASGKSVETNDFIARLGRPVLLLTNNVEAENSNCTIIQMNATEELGGVSSLSYMTTLVALLQLEEQLTGNSIVQKALDKSIQAVEHILGSTALWLPLFEGFITGKDGVQFAAPIERLSSAEQSALMIRECARKKADASEVGDWSHVDVYLTKTTDYKLIFFTGSRWTPQMIEWTSKRNSQVLQIGSNTKFAELDFPHSENGIVQLLVEVTYAELLGATHWYEK